MKKLILLTLLSLITACNSTGNKPTPNGPTKPVSPYQQTLDKYQQRWQQANIKHYSYTFQRICFCPRDYTAAILTEVKNNKVISAKLKSNNQPLDEKLKDNKQTITYFFTKIQDAINKKAHAITIKYNEQYGYPESIFVDYDQRIADEELNLSAKNLVVK